MNKLKKTKKSKIKPILKYLLDNGFLNEWRTTSDVIKKISRKGFTIEGKKRGMVARMLTQMCQDLLSGLEREEIPKEERIGGEKWRFKKVK